MTKRLGWALALAAFLLGSALALRYAGNTGAMGADEVRRAMQVLIGLMLAGYANLMPKQGRGVGSIMAQARVQSALRVGGWSLTLAGVAYAAMWAFAPLPVADTAGLFVVAAATLLTLGYAMWAFTACRRGAPTSR